MNIKDLLSTQLSQDQIEEQIINQGHLVLEVLSLPGWQVILSTLAAVKVNIERDRRNGVRNQTNGERALYFSGRVDGCQETIDALYEIIQAAQKVKEDRALRMQQEAE